MKKAQVLLLLAHTCILALSGQESINNFHIENGELVWQQIFETNFNFDKLTEVIKESGIYENMEISENKIIGDLKQFDADYHEAGYTEMNAPIYISRSHINGFLIIEYKEGRYRASFKKIILTQKYDDPFTRQGKRTELEFYGLKNNKIDFANNFLKAPSEILNFSFTKKFDFKESDFNDNW